MAFEIKRPTHEQGQSVNLGADEEKRIQDALYALATDPHAPREISVKLTLHIHHEYPKHVQRDGATVVVNSAYEEFGPASPASTAFTQPIAHSGLKLEESPEPSGLADMSKAERKEELGGMTKAELSDVAEQHGVHTDSSMNKGKITSALNKQLNREAKTEAKTGTE
jgi:hypothetical protein